MMIEEEAARLVERRLTLGARVRRVLLDRLSVELAPDRIELDMPLFGLGLGLDSVDAVELAIGLEDEFGIEMPAGDESVRLSRSVNTIIDHLVDVGAS